MMNRQIAATIRLRDLEETFDFHVRSFEATGDFLSLSLALGYRGRMTRLANAMARRGWL